MCIYVSLTIAGVSSAKLHHYPPTQRFSSLDYYGAVVGVVGRSFVSIGMDFDPWSVKYNFYSFRVFLCSHNDMGIGGSQLSENLSFPISKLKYVYQT